MKGVDTIARIRREFFTRGRAIKDIVRDLHVWLVREERGSGERKFYLSNLPADATLKQLAAMIKAR